MCKERISTHSMIERMFYINNRIKSGHYPNASKLAKELEVSVSTINRDIEFFRDRLNAPIGYDSARRGYFYTESYDFAQHLA